MDQMSNAEQQQFLAYVDQQQKQEFTNSIVNWTEKSFSVCCKDFTSSQLSDKETSCIKKVFEKHTNAVKRLGLRFAEQNVLFNNK